MTALSIRGAPVVLLAVWARSASEEEHDDAYSPTSAAVAVPVEQLDELVGQLRDAGREAREAAA
ncbi:MAG: hypothetical protein AB7R55_12980 [Gemmatimonadales bacterium]